MDKTLLEIPTELLQAAKLTPEEAKTFRPVAIFPDEHNRLVKNGGQ